MLHRQGMMRRTRQIVCAVGGLAWLIVGCAERETTAEVIEVPKEPIVTAEEAPAPSAPFAPFASGGMPPSGENVPMAQRTLPADALGTGDLPAWTPPSHWQQQAPGAMRKATFAVDGPGGVADVAVTSFPGDVGGLVANVNRWRGQIGLSALPPDEIEGTVTTLTDHPHQPQIVALAGSSQGTLAAIFLVDGQSWFLKLSGPLETVAAEESAFRAWVDSVRFE